MPSEPSRRLRGSLNQSGTLHVLREGFDVLGVQTSVKTAQFIDALDAHQAMSRQALDSQDVQKGLRDILLGPAQLYEMLREAV